MKLENDVPTRLEVEQALASVKVPKTKTKQTTKDKEARNKERQEKVRELVSDPDVLSKLQQDLQSYPQWEDTSDSEG